MAEKEQKFGPYYWNKPNETFAGKRLGEDITDHVKAWADNPKTKLKFDQYVENGWFSTKKPESVEVAKDTELHQLRKTVQDLKEKNAFLRDELDKLPKTVKECRAEIKELKAKVKDGGK